MIALPAQADPDSETPSSSPLKYDEVPTRFIEENGSRYADRRYGKESSVPLVLFAHFRASWTIGTPNS